jgi:hypothetical protein
MYTRHVKGRTYYFHAKTVEGKRTELSLGADRDLAIAKLSAAQRSIDQTWARELRALFYRTKKRAKSRGIEFSLTVENVITMFFASGGRCSLSGQPYMPHGGEGKRFRPWMPSVDRIDPNGPYSSSNSRLICAYVNIAINQFGEDQLVQVAGRIARRRQTQRPGPRVVAESVSATAVETTEKH